MRDLKILLILGVAALITNPLSGQYILRGIENLFALIFSYAVGAGFLMLFLVWFGVVFSKYYKQSEQVNVPVGKKPTGKKRKKWAEFID